MGATRVSKLSKVAAEHGMTIERHGSTYRLVDAGTGTLVAADWTSSDGFGLDLDAVEAALDSI